MRRLIAFPCEEDTLLGTLDEAVSTTGLLIVSGGSEIRAGAHRGMALLAARVAAAGHPVFRFDRRGAGDSEGENGGWASSAPDMAAAAAAFRREQPQLTRLGALGNCDAATALACFARGAGIDALVLTNPWTGEDADGLPPAAAIRRRYAERLRSPAAWRRVLTGDVALGKLARGLGKVARRPPASAASRLATGLAAFPGPITIVLASGDATAIGFRACWNAEALGRVRGRADIVEVPTASHSFQHAADRAALEGAVLAALSSPRA